ncbi:hypothetical protein ABQD92_08530 [Enterococcus avium]|jgi:hypothetical protein|uniref:hypothetical protein n=1 Tax=Enterococcus TaxID=1350 RepID=UPI0028928B16|nr:hypothetical protein [Enterococcus dongliensis]MDT2638650.1 hypothetical protein [Enterococcus dongliensis]
MSEGQNAAMKKSLSEVVTEETAQELASLEGEALVNTFNDLYEQMDYKNLLPEEPTVKSVVQELYELSMARFDEDFDRDSMQDLFYSRIDLLAALLGIELED